MALADPRVQTSPGQVAAKAAFRAAHELGLSQRDLAEAIGVSGATVSRMKDGSYDLAGKPLELALCLIRVFRSLDAIVGGDSASLKGWIKNRNDILVDSPKALILTATGLIEVMQYLDSARAPT